MDKQSLLEIRHNRNKFVLKLVIFSIILSIVMNILGGESLSFILFIAGMGTLLFISMIFLIRRRIMINGISWILVTFMSILTFLMLMQDQHLFTYLMVFYNLAIISMYQDYRPVLFMGLMQILLTAISYNLYSETVFVGYSGEDMVSLYMYIILITGLSTFQGVFSTRLQANLYLREQEIRGEKEQTDVIVEKIKNTTEKLSEFGILLEDNIKKTSEISQVVSSNFGDFAKNMEQQFNSMNDIQLSIQNSDKSIESVSLATSIMKNLSLENVERTELGNREMNELIQNMEGVNHIIDLTSKTIHELNEKNKKISDVIAVINKISEQTNLLALNARIEAARAGEHGTGFSVVANEVLKLAEDSKKYTLEITSILTDINDNTKKAVSQIEVGKDTVHTSKNKTFEMLNVFNEITVNAERVVTKVEENNQMVENLKEHSKDIVTEVDLVTKITKKNEDSLTQVMENVKQQNEKIEEVVLSFKELETSIEELNQLTSIRK